jgi:SfnB family sulfur acquisition oxidoreductase
VSSPSRSTRPPADLIADEAQALAAAARLGRELAVAAGARDAERRLPHAEVRELAASGLLAITVPRAHGGIDAGAATLAEVFRLLAAGDPNVAQIPQSHFVYVNVLKQQGDHGQQAFFFGELLAGAQLANAQSERDTRHVQDYRTRLTRHAGGRLALDGVKHYCTGSLFADWLGVLALDDDGRTVVAFVPADAAGVEIADDWDGMGQRTTASGTVRLTDVTVAEGHVVEHHRTFDGPQLFGAQAQLLHAAIDTGIAGAALGEAVRFVRGYARPWFEAGVEFASDDALLVQRFGELQLTLRSAEVLLADAAATIDAARAGAVTEEAAAAASIAVATAKVAADRAAIELTNALFEVSGTRSSLATLNLDRHWRNARTHTLHDPPRWKLQHIGRHVLNGTPPPRHGLL